MSDTLKPNSELAMGASLVSNSGAVKLVFQGDGNLVLYANKGDSQFARWASNTSGKGATRCAMQPDGNLVIYAGTHALWASNTAGRGAAQLSVQDDENAVLYANGHAIWATNTWLHPKKVVSGFDPAKHGFNFDNGFDHVKFAGFDFGFQGLCAGMSYSCLDYYFAKKPIPNVAATPDPNHDPLGIYIYARHFQSFSENLGHWMPMVLNPDDNALKAWSTRDEWKKLEAKISDGQPVPIGLAKYGDIFNNHVVVAYGCQEGAGDYFVYCYDVNYHRRQAVLYLDKSWKHWRFVVGGSENDAAGHRLDWRGFFVQDAYRPVTPA